jgi:N-acetylglucosamine kinase-like BadF-type ATPase
MEALLEGTGGAEELGQRLDGLIQSTLFDEFSSHLQKSNDDKIAWLKANGHDLATIEEDVLQQQPRGNE